MSGVWGFLRILADPARYGLRDAAFAEHLRMKRIADRQSVPNGEARRSFWRTEVFGRLRMFVALDSFNPAKTARIKTTFSYPTEFSDKNLSYDFI